MGAGQEDRGQEDGGKKMGSKNMGREHQSGKKVEAKNGFQIPDLRFQISDFRSQISQISDLRFLGSDPKMSQRVSFFGRVASIFLTLIFLTPRFLDLVF
jgi:hypothetical protein